MVLAVLVVPSALVLLLRDSRFDVLLESVTFHLWVVSGIAACALVVAGVAARHALASARAHMLPLAVGSLATTMLLMAHGLVTPGVFGRPGNLWVGRLPVLSVATFAVGPGR